MNRPTVLILSSDPAFSREITTHWPHRPHHDQARSSDDPEFTVLEEGFSRDHKESQYDLAIADSASAEKKSVKKKRGPIPNPAELKQSLFAAGKPAILLHSDLMRDFCSRQGPVIELRREPGIWPALTVLIGGEILRRRQAESRASEAESICAVVQNEATLGRYMLEMRTNVNDALTTVLGNAELLAHRPGLPSAVAAQADAIRNMALRLHEVFQRFSSLEKELTVPARGEPERKAAARAGR